MSIAIGIAAAIFAPCAVISLLSVFKGVDERYADAAANIFLTGLASGAILAGLVAARLAQ